MMKKKGIKILVSLILLLTGCSANYKVEFVDGKVKEDVYLFTDNESFIEQTKENTEKVVYQMYLFDKDYDNFETKLEYDEYNTGFNYHTDFTFKKTKDWESVVRQCYDEIAIIKSKDSITIQTSNEFLCYKNFKELENVSITFKTNYVVIDNNADSVSSNKYIWKIEKEDAQYKPLYIKMQNKQIKAGSKKENILPFVGAIIIIIAIISISIFIKKRKKNNDF